MTVAEFLVQLAKKFEDGPAVDLKLAHHCRTYAMISLEHERYYEAARRDAIAAAVAKAKRK